MAPILPAKYVTLFASCIAAISTGTPYVGSAFAPQVGERLGLTSTQVNLMLLAANTSGYLSSPFVGMMVDRGGPRKALLLAAVLIGAGYYGLKIFYDAGAEGYWKTTGLWPLILCETLIGVGSTSSYAGATNSIAKTFSSKRRATALSICIACLGLSAFVYSSLSLYSLLPGIDATSSFLSLLAVGCGGSITLAAIVIRPVPHHHHHHSPPTHSAPGTPNAGLYSPVPTFDRHREVSPASSIGSNSSSGSSNNSGVTTPLDEGVAVIDYLEVARARSKSRERSVAERAKFQELDVSGWELFRTGDFWLLLLYFGLLAGCGLMVINNTGLIVHTLPTLEPTTLSIEKTQQKLVALISIFNSLGRLTYGPLTDALLASRFRIDRVWVAPFIASLFVVVNWWLSRLQYSDRMAHPVALAGYAYGSLCGGIPTLIIEWFGLASFGRNNGFISLSPALFGNVVNILFGRIYDAHVSRSTTSSLVPRGGSALPQNLCKGGNACIVDQFRISTSLACVAVALALALGWRRGRGRTALVEGRV